MSQVALEGMTVQKCRTFAGFPHTLVLEVFLSIRYN